MELTEIIANLKNGDQRAWHMIIDKYSKTVYNMALNFAGNSDDAADITQDIFIRAYNNIDKYTEEKNFNSWLLRLSKNYCIDYWRKNKRNRQQMELDESLYNDEIHDDMITPEDSVVKNSDISFVREKLDRLPPDLRALIIMRDIQEYSYQDIAEHLEIPLGTTKSRINRARIKLAKLMLHDREH